MIESNLELRHLLADETALRLVHSSQRSSVRPPSGLRRRLGRLLLALGARLAAEPPRPIASDVERAGVAPGAWRSARAA